MNDFDVGAGGGVSVPSRVLCNPESYDDPSLEMERGLCILKNAGREIKAEPGAIFTHFKVSKILKVGIQVGKVNFKLQDLLTTKLPCDNHIPAFLFLPLGGLFMGALFWDIGQFQNKGNSTPTISLRLLWD